MSASDKCNWSGNISPHATEELFGKHVRLQRVIDEWKKLGGFVAIRKAVWKPKKKIAIFTGPQARSVEPFQILFKEDKTADEVYLSPEERSLFYEKRTELKKLHNRVDDANKSHVSEGRNQARQKINWLDLGKLAKLATNRLGWPVFVAVLSYGEAGALVDDGVAKLHPHEASSISADSEDEISEALNDPLEPLPESEDEISEALNDPLEPLPESEDEISEALNDPLEPLPESEDEISEALNDPLEPLPESEDEISEALNDPLEPLPESEDEIPRL